MTAPDGWITFRLHIFAIVLMSLAAMGILAYGLFGRPNVAGTVYGATCHYGVTNETQSILISGENQSKFYSHEGNAIILSDDEEIGVGGNNSLRMQLDNAAGGTSIAFHSFNPKQDWSASNAVSFFWYGSRSGLSFRIIVEAGGVEMKSLLTDRWIGWQRIDVPFKLMQSSQAANLTQVTLLAFQLSESTSSEIVWHMASVRIETLSSLPVDYTLAFSGQFYARSNGNAVGFANLTEYYVDHDGVEVFASSQPLSLPFGPSATTFAFDVHVTGLDSPPVALSYIIILRLVSGSGVTFTEIRTSVPASPQQ